MVSRLRFFLFSRFRVQYNGHALAGLDGRKVQELLCYLLVHRDCSHPREKIASLLWKNSSDSHSKRHLRQTLWQLQSALADKDCHDESLISVVSDWIQLNPKADIWLDVAMFEQAFAFCQGISGQELDNQKAEALREAVQLYQGDLLEGWYQDWCLFERERLQNMYLTMLERLIDYCEAHQEYETGLVYGTQVLRYDRAHERTHRRLIRLHYLDGNRTGALRQYERCVAALDEELSVCPAESTERLYQQICSDKFNSLRMDLSRRFTLPEPTTTSLLTLLDDLRRVQSDLARIQGRLQQNIQMVELALGDQS